MNAMRFGFGLFLVLDVLAAPALADNLPIRFKGQLLWRDSYGATLPLAHAKIEFWEDDLFDDDRLEQIETDFQGNFDHVVYTIDQDGLTDPEYNLIVKFENTWCHVGAIVGDTHFMPEGWEIVHSASSDDYPISGGVAIADLGPIVMEQTDLVRRAAGTFAIAARYLPQYHIARGFPIWLNPDKYTTECTTPMASSLDLAWDKWWDADEIVRGMLNCILPNQSFWNGAAVPPGGGFGTVTNEAYAWDQGILAFFTSALLGNPAACGVNLECDVPEPANTADAPRIAANVAASLWDLYDSNPLCEAHAGPGFDSYNGSLDAITGLLEANASRNLGDFWVGWKNAGLPRHLPVLALRLNGVDYDTPPLWVTPEPMWIYDTTQVAYSLGNYVSDAESSDEEMAYSVVCTDASGPVQSFMQGPTLYATLHDPEPPGHALFLVTADDGIAHNTALVKLILGSGNGKPDPDLDRGTPAGPRDGPTALTLTGPTLMRDSGALEFSLPSPGRARLTIRDAAGRTVRQLVDESLPSGRRSARWDGVTTEGTRAPAGVYFAILEHAGSRAVLKLVLLR